MDFDTDFGDEDPTIVVERDPKRVIKTLTASIGKATGDADAATLRLLGMAESETGLYAAAETHLVEAHRRAVESGQDRLAAECRVPLANVVARQGRVRESADLLDEVIPALDGAWLARARSNLVAILLFSDRHDDALAECGRGIEAAERAGEVRSWSSLLNSRGLIHLEAGRLMGAADDFDLARQLLIDAGLVERSWFVVQNLAVTTARLGDVRGAIAMFEAALTGQRASQVENVSLLVDYAETLLLAGLNGDATPLAERALELISRSGNQIEAANLHLLLARCAFANGDPRAGEHCEAAVAKYRALGDDRGVTTAKRLKLLASADGDGIAAALSDSDLALLPMADLAEVAMMASRSSSSGSAPDDTVDALLDEARQLRLTGPLPSRLIGWWAEGFCQRRLGRCDDAIEAVRSGLAFAIDNAAVLGSPAVRQSTLRRLDALCEVGVGAASDAGELQIAARLIDEARTISADLACQAPLSGASAELVARHRAAAQEAEAAPPDSLVSNAALASMAQLERELRRAILATPSEMQRRTALLDPERLCAVQGERAVVCLGRDRGRLVVFVLVDQQITMHDGGDAASVISDAAAVAAALDRLAPIDFDNAAPSLVEALGNSWRAPAGRISDRVFSSALDAIGDRRVVVVPEPGLAGLAWATLPALRGRPVEVAPSISYWAADRELGASDAPRAGERKTVVAIGPDVDVSGRERSMIADAVGSLTLLADDDATVERILSEINGATTLLMSGHGRYVGAHPLLSSVRVADGELCWYDLEAVANLPRTIVWNACQAGSTVAWSNPFTTALCALRRGCELLIGPVCTISDDVAVEVTSELLHHIHSDDPVAALAALQATCHDDPSRWTGLGFVGVGRSR